MYVGDCASSLRYNMFRDYEKHPYGTFEGNYQPQVQRKSYYATVQEKLERSKQQQKAKKEPCPFCKEQKKRPLYSYLRKRSVDKTSNKICEEEEEEQAQQHQQNHCNSDHQHQHSHNHKDKK